MRQSPTPAPTPGPSDGPGKKPFPGFPLFWHKRGYWAVKRGGKHVNYGPDWRRAYDAFREDEKARQAGRAPAPRSQGRFTLADAINEFMSHQAERLADGIIGPVQFAKYRRELAGNRKAGVIGRLAVAIPLSTRLSDFTDEFAEQTFTLIRRAALARGRSVAQRHIILVRALLDFAHGHKLMAAPDYGEHRGQGSGWFAPPSAADLAADREARDARHGARAWSHAELCRMVAAAKARAQAKRSNERNANLWAQILLALNGGFGSGDCVALPLRAVNLEEAVIRFPRVKTRRPRLNFLWPETVAALRHSLAARPKPADEAAGEFFFLNSDGRPYRVGGARLDDAGVPTAARRVDAVAQNFKRLLAHASCRVACPRGAGFYTLRAMCRSLLVGSGADDDLVAVIMGRRFRYPVDEYYLRAELRQKLQAAVDHARSQLFTPTSPAQTPDAAAAGRGASGGKRKRGGGRGSAGSRRRK